MTFLGDDPPDEVIDREVVRAETALMHTAIPARVTKYDHAEQRAEVALAIRHSRQDEDGARQTYLPSLAIANVPVCFPQGGASSITWKLAKGDWVLVIFAERAIGEWLKTGGKDVMPVSTRRFSTSDAMAIPGIRPFADPLPGAVLDEDALVLEHPQTIKVGAGASDYAAMAQDTRDELDRLWDALATHTHTTTGVVSNATPASPGPVTSAGTTAPAGPLGSANSVAATKAQVE